MEHQLQTKYGPRTPAASQRSRHQPPKDQLIRSSRFKKLVETPSMSDSASLICQDVSRSVGHRVNLSGGGLGLLLTCDFVFTQIVVNFFNLASWRGIWNLHDLWFDYVFQV